VNGQYLWLSDATLMAQIRHNIAQAITNSIAGGTPTLTATSTPVVPTVANTSTPVGGGPTNTSVPASTSTATATAGHTSTPTPAPTGTSTPAVIVGGPTTTSVPAATGTTASGVTDTPAATTPPGSASATPTSPPASGNLLSNPSFEAWAGGLPVAWLPGGRPAPAVKEVGTTPQSGRVAAQVSAHGPGAGLYQNLSFPTRLPANGTLTGSAYVRYVSGDTAHAPAITLVLRYADGRQARSSRGVAGWPGHHSWLRVTMTIPARNVPLTSLSFRLVSQTGNAQTFQVDSAAVTASRSRHHRTYVRVRESPQAGERMGTGHLAEAVSRRALSRKDG
jgi:hypothetical protein